MDAMFVDEGFGSLDEDALNQAVKALGNLAEGKKLVGIISHVSELKDRIDKKIVITKIAAERVGSSITVLGDYSADGVSYLCKNVGSQRKAAPNENILWNLDRCL